MTYATGIRNPPDVWRNWLWRKNFLFSYNWCIHNNISQKFERFALHLHINFHSVTNKKNRLTNRGKCTSQLFGHCLFIMKYMDCMTIFRFEINWNVRKSFISLLLIQMKKFLITCFGSWKYGHLIRSYVGKIC